MADKRQGTSRDEIRRLSEVFRRRRASQLSRDYHFETSSRHPQLAQNPNWNSTDTTDTTESTQDNGYYNNAYHNVIVPSLRFYQMRRYKYARSADPAKFDALYKRGCIGTLEKVIGDVKLDITLRKDAASLRNDLVPIDSEALDPIILEDFLQISLERYNRPDDPRKMRTTCDNVRLIFPVDQLYDKRKSKSLPLDRLHKHIALLSYSFLDDSIHNRRIPRVLRDNATEIIDELSESYTKTRRVQLNILDKISRLQRSVQSYTFNHSTVNYPVYQLPFSMTEDGVSVIYVRVSESSTLSQEGRRLADMNPDAALDSLVKQSSQQDDDIAESAVRLYNNALEKEADIDGKEDINTSYINNFSDSLKFVIDDDLELFSDTIVDQTQMLYDVLRIIISFGNGRLDKRFFQAFVMIDREVNAVLENRGIIFKRYFSFVYDQEKPLYDKKDNVLSPEFEVETR